MKEPVLLILDTDIETDCDDAGAMAVMHTLAQKGEVEILAVVCDTGTPWGAASIEWINQYYNRSDIPVGTVKIECYENSQRYEMYMNHIGLIPESRLYSRHITKGTPFEGKTPDNYPDSVEVYRKALAKSQVHSVVICVIGLMTCLEQLLKSGPDEISDLTGHELVRRKVKKLVSMNNCYFPNASRGTFNWKMDYMAAKYVVAHWPTPIAISSEGEHVLTGARLQGEAPSDSPIRQAYDLFLPDHPKRRSSWDQVALLYAIWGEGDFFVEEKGYTLLYDTAQDHFYWEPTATGRKDMNIKVAADPAVLESIIEDLMLGK